MIQKTPLHAAHLALDARMVDFGGWEMPINYGSQIEEHQLVRNQAGMFDVSHMTVVDLRGAQTQTLLGRLLANDIGKLKSPGKALYSCMLNERGGVIDDLIAYYLEDHWYRLVVNAATRDKDLDWITAQAKELAVDVIERPELAMIAVQGPAARERYAQLLDRDSAQTVLDLKRFSACRLADSFVARTGYTGEDGFEIIVPEFQAVSLWENLLEAGVSPAGLGARDTLRLEAGMHLYGQDMDEQTTPLDVGLDWTVSFGEREFIGRNALMEQQKATTGTSQFGLLIQGRGVPRQGCAVSTSVGTGVVTSGTFSPTIQAGIALARLPRDSKGEVIIEIRNRKLPAQVQSLPFVRNGEVLADS